jgi:nucleoside-diphosphate-sugar epimerase
VRTPSLSRSKAASHAPFPRDDAASVAVIGGTGFIGLKVVERLVGSGRSVRLIARNVANPPPSLRHPAIALRKGDIRDADDVARAIGSAKQVINLAHGGGGGSWDEIREGMVGGAENVARACLAAGVERLLHVGSIASLYLGPQPEPVTGAAPPDPLSVLRADYARAKALCDQLLLDLHARDGLPVTILRPGLVVGEGRGPFHSGLGFYNNERHCIGWNGGRNPLPFVLVEDVADAICRALDAEDIAGRSFNLVGDVRPTARQYIHELGRALGRPLRFHGKAPPVLWSEELVKWGIKRAARRRAPLPRYRDILSRGLVARFDCEDAKRMLGWRPVAQPEEFWRRAIGVHAGL